MGTRHRDSCTHEGHLYQRLSCFIQAIVSSSRSLWMTSSVSTLRANLHRCAGSAIISRCKGSEVAALYKTHSGPGVVSVR